MNDIILPLILSGLEFRVWFGVCQTGVHGNSRKDRWPSAADTFRRLGVIVWPVDGLPLTRYLPAWMDWRCWVSSGRATRFVVGRLRYSAYRHQLRSPFVCCSWSCRLEQSLTRAATHSCSFSFQATPQNFCFISHVLTCQHCFHSFPLFL